MAAPGDDERRTIPLRLAAERVVQISLVVIAFWTWRRWPAVGWIWVFAVAAIVCFQVRAWARERVKRARKLQGLCSECGYDRKGLALEATCPECGVVAEGRAQLVPKGQPVCARCGDDMLGRESGRTCVRCGAMYGIEYLE